MRHLTHNDVSANNSASAGRSVATEQPAPISKQEPGTSHYTERGGTFSPESSGSRAKRSSRMRGGKCLHDGDARQRDFLSAPVGVPAL